MTKIFEALEKAEQERKGVNPNLELPIEPSHKVVSADDRLFLERPLTALYQKLYLAMADNDKLILQFIGSGNGDGAVITREFAKVLAFKQKKAVLILDAEQHYPGQPEILNFRADITLDDIVVNNVPLKDAVYQYEDTKLYLTKVSGNGALPALANDMPLFDKILESLRQKFDIVLISSSIKPGQLGQLPFSKKIDGYILIVEAEKTKWQAAKNIKDIIEAQHGNILGVILNKRKYPIPEKIYKML